MQPNLTPELLMPAGNFEKLRFALAYGADAVYAGVPIFSLRARENDFNKENIIEAIDYTHKLGKQIYLTMNIYAHNMKVDKFLNAFCEMDDLQPDAFIMTDPGLINKALKLRPNTVIHLSTQANATNWSTVEFWRDIGVKRIILPRELSIFEIATIHEKVPDIELESFVHGAICIAYSGRCLISNYINHRDANQGTCTNSCRWEFQLAAEKGSLLQQENERQPDSDEYKPLQGSYKVAETGGKENDFIQDWYELDEDEHGTYMMNSKDLCAVELLAELREAGVCSFKVEGRSKSVYYAAVVARAYRHAIDDFLEGKPFDRKHLDELISASSRTLMTGFMKRRPQEYGENFEDGLSAPLTHRFAGVIRDYDEETKLATVDLKNRIKQGDEVEGLSSNETIPFRVEQFFKLNGESADTGHGGMQYKMQLPFKPKPYSLLRLVLQPERSKSE